MARRRLDERALARIRGAVPRERKQHLMWLLRDVLSLFLVAQDPSSHPGRAIPRNAKSGGVWDVAQQLAVFEVLRRVRENKAAASEDCPPPLRLLPIYDFNETSVVRL